MKLSRAAFQDVIETAIQASPSLTVAQAGALRAVAATADRVARGSFEYKGLGCPLTQAGIARLTSDGGADIPSGNEDACEGFWYAFDRATVPLARRAASLDERRIIEVTP